MSQASTSFSLGSLNNQSGYGNTASFLTDSPSIPATMKNNPILWLVGGAVALALVCFVLLKSK